MTDKIFQTIRKYDMIHEGDTVAVCLSGGRDSMALFHFMVTNSRTLGIKVLAIHVNHGLREESRQEEEFVKSYCASLGVECLTRRLEMNDRERPSGLSTESWARDLRYRFFGEVARERSAKLATAHTASDRRETVLFNITRGTGIKGASGIPPVRDNIIRPLIACTRREIEDYCEKNSLRYVTDRTNFETVYSRNKIRLEVLPVLREINSRAEESIVSFASDAEDIYTLLTQLSDNLYEKSKREGGLDAATLLKADGIVLRTLLRRELDERDCLSRDNLNAVLSLLSVDGPMREIQLKGDVFAVIEGGILTFASGERREIPPIEIPVSIGESREIFGHRILLKRMSAEELSACAAKGKAYLKQCIDYDKIGCHPVLRNRRTGDTITLGKRKVTKKVKKLLIEDKVPLARRDLTPILSDESGRVIWMKDYGVSALFAADEDTVSAIYIELM
ncbi:MAG: tRNA lysidine(34) synthetase TilS [Oscillospiraceae bacterium]|nr:tRNA lysidine(34) synthetase TilS [Oscillospiraceae bacterium]